MLLVRSHPAWGEPEVKAAKKSRLWKPEHQRWREDQRWSQLAQTKTKEAEKYEGAVALGQGDLFLEQLDRQKLEVDPGPTSPSETTSSTETLSSAGMIKYKLSIYLSAEIFWLFQSTEWFVGVLVYVIFQVADENRLWSWDYKWYLWYPEHWDMEDWKLVLVNTKLISNVTVIG